MTAPHKPIYPGTFAQAQQGTGGITLREHYAGLAMQGILSDAVVLVKHSHKQIATVAVNQADALIQALKDNPA